MNGNRFFRPAIAAMQGYQPGAWPALDAGVLKLNSNENPYPPSPQVLAALKDFAPELLRRYPDPRAEAFCQVASETFGVPAAWAIAGNGSDDLLTLLVRACAEGKERALAYPAPTYVLYETLAAMQPAKTLPIAYRDNWQLPLEELVAADAAVTLVATPNSPSGHVVAERDLRALAEGLSGVLVIDEAYIDFVEGENADRASLALVRDYENVVVLRTLSKGYALAGLRLGFGFARPALLAGLLKVKDSYNVDALALHLGAVAIADRSYKQAIAQKIIAARAQLTADLQQLNFQVWPSQTNFVWVQPPRAPGAQAICEGLKRKKIMIRHFDRPGLDDCLRITVGTPDQNAQLVGAIREIAASSTAWH